MNCVTLQSLKNPGIVINTSAGSVIAKRQFPAGQSFNRNLLVPIYRIVSVIIDIQSRVPFKNMMCFMILIKYLQKKFLCVNISLVSHSKFYKYLISICLLHQMFSSFRVSGVFVRLVEGFSSALDSRSGLGLNSCKWICYVRS